MILEGVIYMSINKFNMSKEKCIWHLDIYWQFPAQFWKIYAAATTWEGYDDQRSRCPRNGGSGHLPAKPPKAVEVLTINEKNNNYQWRE